MPTLKETDLNKTEGFGVEICFSVVRYSKHECLARSLICSY
jgi:hypothetical protein